MPLPKPREGESRDDFLDRCMGNATMVSEYEEEDQRYAVCNDLWERRDKMRDTKVFRTPNLKFDIDGEEGSFRAIFATLNVVDADGDLTLPGAFGEQQVIISAYGHASWGGALPVGKGRIFEQGEDAIVEGRFFLDTQAGKETYTTVKNVNELQEWSYALPEIDYEMREQDGQRIRVLKRIRVNEVSPVLMGVGVNTRLLDIKSAFKRAIGSHSTTTNDGAWDAGANEKRVRKDESAAYYRKIYAWQDPDGETGNKSTYKFIHHFVGADGDPGAASTRACSNGIAILNGARGGTNIPDADRQGVWRHLAKHLRDADKEPPELRSLDAAPQEMKLLDHLELVLADVNEVSGRLRDVKSMREAKGRSIAEATAERMGVLADALGEAAKELRRLQKAEHDEAGLQQEFLSFQKLIAERRENHVTSKTG